MIKARIDEENEKDYVEIGGKLKEILTDAALIVSEVYAMIKEENPGAAEYFKRRFTQLVTDEKSPMWEVDIQEALKALCEKLRNREY